MTEKSYKPTEEERVELARIHLKYLEYSQWMEKHRQACDICNGSAVFEKCFTTSYTSENKYGTVEIAPKDIV